MSAIALGVFAGIGLLWLTSGVHGLDVTFVAHGWAWPRCCWPARCDGIR